MSILSSQEIIGFQWPKFFHVILVLDATQSMSNWTQQLTNALQSFTNETARLPSNFIFSVISYKDHPSEDSDYLARVHGVYTENEYKRMLIDIRNIRLSGGGDLPECVGSGLAYALVQAREFRRKVPLNAFQYVLLMGDYPHHGYAARGTKDNLQRVLYRTGRKGCCDNDPLLIAVLCSELKIPICTVALSNREDTKSLFHAIAELSHGVFVSSSNSSGGIAQAIFEALLHPFHKRRLFFSW